LRPSAVVLADVSAEIAEALVVCCVLNCICIRFFVVSAVIAEAFVAIAVF
jgi:hypothetical protein